METACSSKTLVPSNIGGTFSGLKLETICFFETFVPIYQPTLCHRPHKNLNRRVNHKSHNRIFVSRLTVSTLLTLTHYMKLSFIFVTCYDACMAAITEAKQFSVNALDGRMF